MKKLKLTATQIITIGFALIILIGTLLLSLPVSNRDGRAIPFVSALFTSCSASCVTGLVVFDTWTQFSVFGQVVLLVLIQLGGLGFMTFAIMFSMAFGRRVGLRERINMSESVGADRIGGVVRLARRILLGTLIIEVAGALLLMTRFIPVFGAKTGVWYAVFHSVSAFCNAGFDLMGRLSPGSSLTYFVGDAVVCVTIMALILIGGAGFIVWDDLVSNRFKFRALFLHTKLMLVSSAVAVLLGAALFLVTERNDAFAGLTSGERVLAAFFASVTPRTAGFNTTDLTALSGAGAMLTMLLMFMGAGSGSTGGGVKLSTLSVLVLAALSYVRRGTEVNAFGRRIESEAVKKAFSLTLIYLTVLFTGCFLILVFQDLPFRETLFECISAISTVGLTANLTGSLSDASRLVIVLLMYTGRVGSLTVFVAVAEARSTRQPRYPADKVIIG